MLHLIKNFPQQMLDAIAIGKTYQPSQKASRIQYVIVSGLGGSGIGGNLASELLDGELKVPIVVNKGYSLPGFANERSLIILSSYSGNTEETLSVGEQAKARGLRAVCITSGGKLQTMAQANGWDCILIPAGFPPRTCLGYSITQLLFVLYKHKVVSKSFIAQLKTSAKLLKKQQKDISAEAKALAEKLVRKIIIAYADEKMESTVLRLKQQLNENSKSYSWHNAFPEMNHNELVSWRERKDDLAVLYFRSSDDNARNAHRFGFSANVLQQLGTEVHEVRAIGEGTFEQHFHLIHFGDWLSYHLAILQGYDPMEIEVLVNLKNFMSDTP